MSKKTIRVQLELSPKDQKDLNYQNPILEWDYQALTGEPSSFSINSATKDRIIRAIRKDLHIPPGYLEDYRIVFKENVLLVIP